MQDQDNTPVAEAECPNCRNGTVGMENGRLVCRGECGTDFGPQTADPNADEFQCEHCHDVFDIEDSIKVDDKLVCVGCAGHEPGWIEKHSVNCYFCHVLFDERDGTPADMWNNNDGGTACPKCAAERGEH